MLAAVLCVACMATASQSGRRNKRKDRRRQTIRARGDDPPARHCTLPLSCLWVHIMVQYKEAAAAAGRVEVEAMPP